MTKSASQAIRAQKSLKSLVLENGSWREVVKAKNLTCSHTMLAAVACGKRKPPYKLLEALNIVSKRKPEVIRLRWIGRWAAEHGQGFIP